MRLLRDPDADVAVRTVQLQAGRLAGRGYSAAVNARERARIQRARLPDRLEPLRSTLSLVRPRRGLIIALVVLIAVGLALDAAVRRFGPGLADALGIDAWLRDTFTRPDEDTLRNLLAAAAAGTATILGLVLSISLIVWQTTAERYRSSPVILFLLREPLGAAVVRLLALGFAYSLWVLALLEVAGQPAYVSAGMAMVLSTVAVLSLIEYRERALLGYQPRSIATSLCGEIAGQQAMAARRGAGRSVADFGRRVVADDLRILDDLIGRLLEDDDAADVASCIAELGRALARHLQIKPRLDPESLFFERHSQRLPARGLPIEESIVAEGLMDPTSLRPDHVWVIRRVLAIAQRVVDSDLFTDSDVAEAVFRLWAQALQLGWHLEDEDAVALSLDAVERAASDPRIVADADLAEHVTTIAWLVVNAVGGGVDTTAETIVASEPWRNEPVGRFPWRAQEDARRLGSRVRREIAIVGRVVSPTWAMVASVDAERAPRLREQRRLLVARAVALCRGVLVAAAEEASIATPRAAKMTLRVWLRMVHHGLEPPDFADVVGPLMRAVGLSRDEELEGLRVDAGRVARVFAEGGHLEAAYGALDVVAHAGLVARARENDDRRRTVFFFDTAFTAALLYAWGEFYRRRDHLGPTSRYVQPPFANLDAMRAMLKRRGLWDLQLPRPAYHTWFQPLVHAVHDLPDRVARRRGLGFETEKDHPSKLIAGAGRGLRFGADDCLRALVEATVAQRDAQVARLAGVLRTIADARERG